MLKSQRGLSISGLLLICVVLIAVVIIGFKLFPAYTEYLQVRKAITEITNNPESRGTLKDVQAAFDRRAAIDNIRVISGTDLEITKQGDRMMIAAAWSVKVPLFYNISACMDFEVRGQ
jgi:hypothetical protein